MRASRTGSNHKWRKLAVCTDADLTHPFGDDDDPDEVSGQKARMFAGSVCGMCPVRKECLAFALDFEAGSDYRYGVFGGLLPHQREQIANQATT